MQENCYRSTLGWIKQNLREGKKITFDELRQRYLHDFLQWYVKAIRGEPQYAPLYSTGSVSTLTVVLQQRRSRGHDAREHPADDGAAGRAAGGAADRIARRQEGSALKGVEREVCARKISP